MKDKIWKGCGLMQESKDIQLKPKKGYVTRRCGLMQESKDIQLNLAIEYAIDVVV